MRLVIKGRNKKRRLKQEKKVNEIGYKGEKYKKEIETREKGGAMRLVMRRQG